MTLLQVSFWHIKPTLELLQTKITLFMTRALSEGLLKQDNRPHYVEKCLKNWFEEGTKEFNILDLTCVKYMKDELRNHRIN